jgi:hypothetical protein
MSVANQLTDIKNEIKVLIDNALHIIKNADKGEYERARMYWYAHIVMALDKEHEYLGGSMFTMQDSIDAISGEIDSEEFLSRLKDKLQQRTIRDLDGLLDVADGIAKRMGFDLEEYYDCNFDNLIDDINIYLETEDFMTTYNIAYN